MQDSFAEIAAIGEETTARAVIGRMVRYLNKLGFQGYALGQLPVPPEYLPGGFLFHNWPEDFSKSYEDQELGRDDPTLQYVMTQSRPVSIGSLFRGEAGVVITETGKKLQALAKKHGAAEGAVIPIFGPRGYRALAAFMRPNGEPDAAALSELRLLAITVHDRLVELQDSLHRKTAPTGAPDLTDRERAVLAVARDGKADADIALALDISVRTVRFHFSNARKKLGATNRAAALLTATNQHLI